MTVSPPPVRRLWPRFVVLALPAAGGLLTGPQVYACLSTPQTFYGTASPAGRVAPTMLALLERVPQVVPPSQRDRFQTLLVSVDPACNMVPKLREYVRFFSPRASTSRGSGIRPPPGAWPSRTPTSKAYR